MRTEDLATLDLHAVPSAVERARRDRPRLDVEGGGPNVGRFVPGFTHEVNNALNAVLGYADLLAGELEATSDVEIARDIGDAASRVVHLVRQLRALGEPREVEPEWRPAAEAIDLSARVLKYILPRRTRIDSDAGAADGLALDVRLLDRLFSQIGSVMTGLFDTAESAAGAIQILAREQDAVGPQRFVEVAIIGTGEPGVACSLCADADLVAAERVVRSRGGWLDVDARLDGGLIVRLNVPARFVSSLLD